MRSDFEQCVIAPASNLRASAGQMPWGRNTTTTNKHDAVDQLLDAGDIPAESSNQFGGAVGEQVSSAAPMIGPNNVPMPPMTGPEDDFDRAAHVKRSAREKDCCNKTQETRRPTPVIAALIATASIFQRKVLMPSACAASSFSRIACQ